MEDNTSNMNFADATYANPEVHLAKPSMFKVMLVNDDYTPTDFVCQILQKFFRKSQLQAQKLTMQISSDGVAICGFYTRDVAETKVGIVNDFAAKSLHPLKCTFEEDI